MRSLRSSKSLEGRKMAGARSLWRANGMKEEQMGKPVIAVVNSFTQFVPGHVHLHVHGGIHALHGVDLLHGRLDLICRLLLVGAIAAGCHGHRQQGTQRKGRRSLSQFHSVRLLVGKIIPQDMLEV